MVRLANSQDRERDFIDKLFSKSHEENRCPYLRKDEISAYCSKNLVEGQQIAEQRRLVCDKSSLQLWCLDKSRCEKCIWYQGEPFK